MESARFYWYNDQQCGADVTSILKHKCGVTQSCNNVQATAGYLGIRDPCPGRPKQLVVYYGCK